MGARRTCTRSLRPPNVQLGQDESPSPTTTGTAPRAPVRPTSHGDQRPATGDREGSPDPQPRTPGTAPGRMHPTVGPPPQDMVSQWRRTVLHFPPAGNFTYPRLR